MRILNCHAGQCGILLVILFTGSLGFSKNAEKAQKNNSESSESKSPNRNFGFAAKFGYSGIGFLTPGIELLGILNERSQINLNYFQSSQSFTDRVPDSNTQYVRMSVDEAKILARAVILGGRYFVGRTFFIGGGMGYGSFAARYKLNFEIYPLPGDDQIHLGSTNVEINAQTIFVNANIGNQWLFSNGFFIIGEWIGVAAPASSKFSASRTSTDSSPFASNRDAEVEEAFADGASTIKKRLTKSPQLLMMLSAGWSF